jgi:segregation and condensation protein A
MIVRELGLDLDAFEGPFDLLLTLVLKEELDLRDVDVVAIVLAFLERLSEQAPRPRPPAPTEHGSAATSVDEVGSPERELPELDLEACGEFLVLVSALLELKARGLFPEEAAELAELEPEVAAEELARRLAEYRRMKDAAAWMRDRLGLEGDRFFRAGPPPLAPRAELRLVPQEAQQLAEVMRALAVEPPPVSLAHMALRFPPVVQFLERFRAVLRRRSRFDFDAEVDGLTRIEQAVAFLALLDLRRAGEVSIDQAFAFAPIRVARAEEENRNRDERTVAWTARSA